MKSKSKFQLSVRFFSMVLIFSIFSFCNLDTPKDSEKKAFLKKNIPISFSFMDTKFSLERAKPNEKKDYSIARTAILKVKVSAIDPLKKVLTPNGTLFKSVNVSGGVMALYLSNKATLPYQFVIKVEAPGYVTTYKQIRIAENQPCYFPVYLVNFTSSEQNVFNQESTLNLKYGKTAKDEYIGKPGIAQVLIPEGNAVFTRGKKVQSESATIKLSYCITDSINSIAFPSGYQVANVPKAPPITNPKITNSTHYSKITPLSSEPFHLLPYCWLTLEMQANRQNITQFEKPIKINLTFPYNEWNVQELLKNKDLVDLWSLSDDGVWKNEGKVKVQKNDNQLFSVSFETKHLTTFTVANTENPCTDQVLTINYKSAKDQPLFSKLIHYPSGIDYGFTSDNNITYNEGNHSISISNVPAGRQLRFVVYDDQTGVGLIRDRVSATTFECDIHCDESLNLSPRNTFSKTLRFVKERSPGENLALCEMPIWFKTCNSCGENSDLMPSCITDSRAYEFGGYLDSNGEITLTQTTSLNRIFCIRLCYSSQVGQTISSEYLDLLIDLRNGSLTPIAIQGRANNANINLHHTLDDDVHILKILSAQTVPINACIE